MRAHIFTDNGDLEVDTEAVSTWNIQDWRRLPRKTHSPIFDCDGHPW